MKIKTIIIIAAAIILCGFFSSIFVFDPFNLHLNFFNRELSIEKTANVISEIKKISEFTTACYFEDKIIEQKKYKYFEKKINKQEQREQNAKDIKTSAVSSFKKLKEAASSAIDRAKQSSDSTKKGFAASVGTVTKEVVGAAGSSIKQGAKAMAPALKDMVTADEIKKDSTQIGRIVFTVNTKVRAGYNLSNLNQDDLVISGDTLKINLPPVEIFDIIANPSDWKIFHREGTWEDDEIRTIQSKAREIIREDAIASGLLEKAASCGKEELVSLFKTFGFSVVALNE